MIDYAIDSETFLFVPGNRAPPPVCWSIADATSESLFSATDGLDWLERALREGKTLGFANAPYDLIVASNARPALLPLIFRALDLGQIKDCLTRQALIDLARGCLFRDSSGAPLRDPETGKVSDRYSLSIVAGICLGTTMAKKDTWRLRYGELAGIPLSYWPPEAIEYPKQDARVTFDCISAQEGGPNLSEETQTNQANFALALSSAWGIRTDPVAVASLSQSLNEEYAKNQARFFSTGIVSIKRCGPDETPDEIPPEVQYLCDPKQRKWIAEGKARYCEKRAVLQGYVERAYQGQPPRGDVTELQATRGQLDGGIKIDGDTLAESGDPLLEEYEKTGQIKKLKRSFIPVLELGATVGINPSITVLLDSGRTSYRKPNLQQLPRKGGVRECFVARKRYVFSAVDYGTLELCTLAQTNLWLFGWSRMAEAINSGRDLHCMVASQMLGRSYEEILAGYKSGDSHITAVRQLAKIANFGFGGGMGPVKFISSARAQDVRLCSTLDPTLKCGSDTFLDYSGKPVCSKCLEVAKMLKTEFLRTWEEMPHYFARIGELTADGETAIRVLPDGIVRADCDYCTAANMHFQGLAARLAKQALYRVSREAHTDPLSPLWGSRPCVFVHDEIIAECPEANASDATARIEEIMIKTAREYCPDVAFKADGHIMRRWYKGAKAVRGADGKLVPWEPKETHA